MGEITNLVIKAQQIFGLAEDGVPDPIKLLVEPTHTAKLPVIVGIE